MRYSRKIRAKRVVIFIFSVLLIFGILTVWLIDRKVRPMIQTYGNNQAVTAATRAVNDAVERVLNKTSIEYDRLSSVIRDEQGEISLIEINTGNVNLVKSAASTAILEELKKQKFQKVEIPAGSLAGGLLTGRGPNITIKVPMNSTVETTFSNKFEGVGINQTRHYITIDVKVKIFTVIQGKSIATEVETEFTVAECIIIGEVPQWMVARSQ
ncbi:MAG: sporulation protein YunB [Oscillospiraceae bacterium]|nr:sporulation protein YunB [Oscillospiraceae bacterium]MDD3832291.1 sporulation protein YunB [Oscillospiraceae bacterium]MDD4546101.1 sporulation protein YunB [Oscillospiraceae bacterium]